MDQIVPILKIDVRLFQWQCIFRDINRLWFCRKVQYSDRCFSSYTRHHYCHSSEYLVSRYMLTQTIYRYTITYIRTSASALVARFCDCVDTMKSWMASNRLRLNPSKTEMIWLGSTGQLRNCPMSPLLISGVWITPSSKVRNLGVIIDDALTMSVHVNKLVSTCFFHLRQLRMVCRSLDVDAAHALVRALIHSRLDYCNGVLAGLPLYMFKRLQSVLSAAARLVLVLPGRQSVSIPMRKQISTACSIQTVRPFLQMPARSGTRISIQTVRTDRRHSRPCASQVSVGRSACGAVYEQKKHLVTKAFSTQAPLPRTIFPVSCVTMLQRLL